MIIKARCRGFAKQLGEYLRDPKNERVTVLEAGASGKMESSLRDMERIGNALTTSEKPLYHACLRAAPGEYLTPEQWQYSVDKLGQALKLDQQDRVIVLHTLKDGSTHAHAVWSRVDVENERVISNSWDAIHWHKTARILEKELGLQQLESRVPDEVKGQSRSQTQTSKARQMEVNGGKDTAIIKAEVSYCWQQSATGAIFRQQLSQMGYELRQGERSAYVLIDESTGKPYNPARLIEGVKTKDLKAKCGDLEPLTEAERPRPIRDPKPRQAERLNHDQANQTIANDNRHGGTIPSRRPGLTL